MESQTLDDPPLAEDVVEDAIDSNQGTEHSFLRRCWFALLKAPNGASQPSLPRTLQLFFGLNGLSLSLQTLPLLYILNTRVPIPLELLGTYGAVAFLPYSLKPLYGYLTSTTTTTILFCSRRQLYSTLLLLYGASLLATCWLPSLPWLLGGALLRGLSDAWSEFCLGLTLVDHARWRSHENDYAALVSHWQAQAATARNAGSCLGTAVTWLVLFVMARYQQHEQHEPTVLNDRLVNIMLQSTAVLEWLGALVVALGDRHDGSVWEPMTSRLGRSRSLEEQRLLQETTTSTTTTTSRRSYCASPRPELVDDDDDNNNNSFSSALDSNSSDDDSLHATLLGPRRTSPTGTSGVTWPLVALLQLAVVCVAWTSPMSAWTGNLVVVWKTAMALTLGGLVVAAALVYYRQRHWKITHQVGLFLLLRHAVPNDTMILASFVYTLLESDPIQLQLLSLVGIGMITLASWSYGHTWSKYSTGRPFLGLVFGTTVLSALAKCMGYLFLYYYFRYHYRSGNDSHDEHNQGGLLFLVALIAKALDAFFGEWMFLPDVVLCSTSLSCAQDAPSPPPLQRENSTALDTATVTTQFETANTQDEIHLLQQDSRSRSVAVEYGTLISCIDFGDQLGSLLSSALVWLLGISRDNAFLHLERLIIVSNVLAVVSTFGLLALLWKR